MDHTYIINDTSSDDEGPLDQLTQLTTILLRWSRETLINYRDGEGAAFTLEDAACVFDIAFAAVLSVAATWRQRATFASEADRETFDRLVAAMADNSLYAYRQRRWMPFSNRPTSQRGSH